MNTLTRHPMKHDGVTDLDALDEFTYVYDLTDPAVQEQIRQLGANFVQWDLLFDTRFQSVVSDTPPDLNPETPRPELHYLRLPFRF